jgi:hypothetical protein
MHERFEGEIKRRKKKLNSSGFRHTGREKLERIYPSRMSLTLSCILAVAVAVVFAVATEIKGHNSDHPQASRIHDLFVQEFPGGSEGLLEALRERSDWSPLQIFEYQSEDIVGAKWDRFNAMGPVVQCPSKILETFGKGDEEKRICGSIKDNDCVVISVGSLNLWGFEEAVIAKYPHCHIHTFDCFATYAKVPAAIQKQVTLYPICLGLQDAVVDGREFMTWPSVAARIGLTKPPSALKMDIEGYEWTTIPAIIKSNLLVPESFSFELHYKANPRFKKDLVWGKRGRSGPEIGLFMELLYNLGYVLVDRHDNRYCPVCTEIVVSKLVPNSRFAHHLQDTLLSNFASNGTHPNVLKVDPYPTLHRKPTTP